MQLIPYQVTNCPRCGKEHSYLLNATIEETKSPLFGGPGDKIEIALDCPNLKETFIQKIDNPINGEIIGVATETESKSVYTTLQNQASDTKKESEYEEWIKQSRDKALSFCSTMLTNSTGAIGVYFAIQKYLGLEKIESSIQNITIIPPILYLISSIIFILAQKPQFIELKESEFNNYKRLRLKLMNKYLLIGTFIFMLATLISIIIFYQSMK